MRTASGDISPPSLARRLPISAWASSAGDPLSFEWDQLCAAEASGAWTGDPAMLWALLFLEHRRWRTSPVEPGAKMTVLLDRLCQQLRRSLLAS